MDSEINGFSGGQKLLTDTEWFIGFADEMAEVGDFKLVPFKQIQF